MSQPAEPARLVVVLAANGDDYVDWCWGTGRQPLAGTAWMISPHTGKGMFSRRFMVTKRWREDKRNRRFLAALREDGVPYGDEFDPWPTEMVPDLSWPTLWDRIRQRLTARD